MQRPLMIASLILLIAQRASAGEIVDSRSALKTVRTEFGLADGPSWNGEDTLYVPDVKAGTLRAFRPRSGEWQIVLPDAGRISATFYAHDRLYLADNGASSVAILNGSTKEPIAEFDPQAKPPNRPNDLVVDADGGIYVTITPTGEVRYIAVDGEYRVALSGIETPNGIALSPDGRTLYVSAYAPKKILAYEVKSAGFPLNGWLFAEMDDGPAKGADGMTVDADGNVYCAGATDIWIWNSEGELIEKLETPERPINCTFGDSDLKTLYITGFGGLWSQRMRVSGNAALRRTGAQ